MNTDLGRLTTETDELMANANDWLRLRELAADRSRPKSGKYTADEREDPHEAERHAAVAPIARCVMKRKLRSLAWLSFTVLPLPVQSVHELLLAALLAGGITLAHGVVREFAEFFSDAAAGYCSYLRRQLNIERRRDIAAGPP